MKPSKLIIHSAIASVFFGMAVHVNATPIKTENLQSFYERVAKDQATPSDLNTVVSSNPLEQKALQKSMPGLFSSYVHFNFSQSNSKFIKPKWLTSTIRDHLKIYDGNFFVTAWIVENLLQAHQFAPTAFTLNQGLLDHAITALGQFHDKNAPQTAQISFWPQIYDTDQHVWTAYPSNLMAITEKQGMFYNWMMGVCMNAFPNNGVCFQIYNELPPIFSDAFAIPSDNDDSALNLVMGESVMSAAKEYPNAAAIWASRNSSTQIANYFRALLRTTYHMASANADAHTIDPRTYYFLRNDPKVASSTYITTWLDSISQERILVQDKADTMPKVAMPFNVNNIDPSVNANTLYALSKLSNQSPLGEAALSQLSEQERAELQTIELSTAHFLSWVINNRLALDRPDIVTIYYPSKYNLIWFSSKIDAYLHVASLTIA